MFFLILERFLNSRFSQCEFTCYLEFTWALACVVLFFCNFVCRGLWFNEVGRSRDPDYQLLFSGRCSGDVGFPEYGVRDTILFFPLNVSLSNFFLSCREGWNQYMHDLCVFLQRFSPFTFISSCFFSSDLIYPRCTKGVETDCGSTAWAFSLFIAWNLLSMVCAFRH